MEQFAVTGRTGLVTQTSGDITTDRQHGVDSCLCGGRPARLSQFRSPFDSSRPLFTWFPQVRRGRARQAEQRVYGWSLSTSPRGANVNLHIRPAHVLDAASQLTSLANEIDMAGHGGPPGAAEVGHPAPAVTMPATHQGWVRERAALAESARGLSAFLFAAVHALEGVDEGSIIRVPGSIR